MGRGWYRRGYYDDGPPLGSAHSAECRIDSLAQSWAVLSRQPTGSARAAAMDAARRHLVREADGLILLLAPPFDRGTDGPRLHQALSARRARERRTVHACRDLGRCGRWPSSARQITPSRLFQKLLPVRHARTREAVARYRVEPYVLAADVYGAPPWTGRGGWTWYTGAAGWAYRFGLEVLLGIRPDDGAWRIDPCIPRHWPGFEVTLRDGATSFRIRVANPRGVSRGVAAVLLDGVPLAEPVLPRLDDRGLHEVEITMG